MLAALVYAGATLGFILVCWTTLKTFTAPFTEMLPWYDPAGPSFQPFFCFLFPAMILVSVVNRMCGRIGLASPAQQRLPLFTAMLLGLAAGGGAAESHALQAAGAITSMVSGFSALILCVDDLMEFWEEKACHAPQTVEGHRVPAPGKARDND